MLKYNLLSIAFCSHRILFARSTGNSITKENTGEMRAKIVTEGANWPTTPEAYKALFKKKAIFVPDILANAGRVTAGYYEWVQNLEYEPWTVEEANSKLESNKCKAFNDVYTMSKKQKCEMRTAPLMLDHGRVAEAIKTLELWP